MAHCGQVGHGAHAERDGHRNPALLDNLSDTVVAMILRTSALAVLASATLAALSQSAAAGGQMSLIELEGKVSRDYQDISHVIPEQLEAAMRHPEALLLLDARDAEEIAVSRLPGAVAVDPDISTDDFMQRFAAAARSKDVVIYCSVGVRSSKLATRVRAAVLATGARSVANLQGGIFAMHNTGRTLVDGTGAIDFVHPYSRWWSSYLDFDDLARYRADRRATPLPPPGAAP